MSRHYRVGLGLRCIQKIFREPIGGWSVLVGGPTTTVHFIRTSLVLALGCASGCYTGLGSFADGGETAGSGPDGDDEPAAQRQPVASDAAPDEVMPEWRRLTRSEYRATLVDLLAATMLDLMVKLDVPDVDGTSILDNTLIIANSQSGAKDHYQDTMPIMLEPRGAEV